MTSIIYNKICHKQIIQEKPQRHKIKIWMILFTTKMSDIEEKYFIIYRVMGYLLQA